MDFLSILLNKNRVTEVRYDKDWIMALLARTSINNTPAGPPKVVEVTNE